MWKLVFLFISAMVVEHQQYNIDHMVRNQNDQIVASGDSQKQLELMVELQKLVNNQLDLEYLVKQNHRDQVKLKFFGRLFLCLQSSY